MADKAVQTDFGGPSVVLGTADDVKVIFEAFVKAEMETRMAALCVCPVDERDSLAAAFAEATAECESLRGGNQRLAAHYTRLLAQRQRRPGTLCRDDFLFGPDDESGDEQGDESDESHDQDASEPLE